MTLRFGEFRLDSDRRELRRGMEPVSVPPKVFSLLEALIEKHPRAVAQQDLYDRLWPGTFVRLTNLHNLVYQLREALDDHEHRLIRTVYGFGFAFDGEIISEAAFSRCRLLLGDSSFDLRLGENLVGRDRTAPVRIDAPSVSRLHAKIVVVGESAVLEDLGSKNGTWIERKRVRAPIELRDGNQILFGEIAVTFAIAPLDPSTDTVDR